MLDDIFNDMSFFLTINIDLYKNVDYISNGFSDFILDIMLSKTYTNNLAVRNNFIKIIFELIKSKKDVDECINKYANALIVLHNDIHQSSQPLQQQLQQKFSIYTYFYNSMGLNIKFDKIMANVMLNNLSLTKKLIHSVLMDLSTVNDIMNGSYKQIDELRKNNNNNRRDRSIRELEHEIADIMMFYLGILKFMYNIIIIVSTEATVFELLLSNEIFSSLVTVINQNVNRIIITMRFKANMNLTLYKEAKVNIKEYVNYILDVLNIIIRKNDMMDFVRDHIFKIENYDKLQSHVKGKKYGEIFERLRSNMIKLTSGEDDEDIEYPDEFLDPITYSPISEPCLIPSMNGFDDLYFDKSTIMKQLLIREENPYTRKHLTLEEFEKYNELEEIKLKNNIFMNRVNDYKKNIKK